MTTAIIDIGNKNDSFCFMIVKDLSVYTLW